MKTFQYKGFDSGGHQVRGLIEALTVKDAREKLSARGILAEKMDFAVGGTSRLTIEQRANIYREISSLLSAGFPLTKALDVLVRNTEYDQVSVMIAGIRDRIREGSQLADALSKASDSVTSYEKAIIEAAEESATVELMLNRLADFLDEQSVLRDRIRNALTYPLIVITLGICAAMVIFGILLPKAQGIFAQHSMPLPLITRIVMTTGAFIVKWFWLFLVAGAGAIFFFRYRHKTDPGFRERWDSRLFDLPLIGKGYRIIVNQRFAKTMAILLEGGVSMVDAYKLSGRATGSSWISKLTEEGSEEIRHGNSMSEVLRKIPPLGESLPEWIKVGEASGGLPLILSNVGDKYHQKWNRYITSSLTILEPVVIILMGLFVGLVTIAVLVPIFSLSDTLGR